MTIGSNQVRRLEYIPEATWDTTAPVAGDSWLALNAENPPPPPIPQPVAQRQVFNMRGNPSDTVPLSRNGTELSLSAMWCGGSAGFDGTGGDTDPTTFLYQDILETLFGADADGSFTGNTVGLASGPGQSSAMVITSAANLQVGLPIMVNGEFRAITAISGTDITLNADLSASPSQTDVVYGCWLMKPAMVQYAKAIGVNYERDDHSYLYYPGHCHKGTLKGSASGVLMLEMGLRFRNWTSGVTPSSAPTDSYTGVSPVQVAGGDLIVGTTTGICIADFSLDIGIQKEDIECGSSSQGVNGMKNVSVAPVLSVKEYYASARVTSHGSKTGTPVFLAVTSATTDATKARSAVCIFLPNAEVTTGEDAQGNKNALSTTFRGKDPTAAQVTAGLTSSIYAGFFGGV